MRRSATSRLATVVGANVALLVALLAVIEVVLAVVRKDHISPWQRRGSYRLASDVAPARRSSASTAIATTFRTRPVLNAHPSYTPLDDAGAVDRSREWSADITRRPGFLPAGYSGRSLVTAEHGSAVVWDVHVDTDAFGRRVTWARDGEPRRRFVAVFGCSVTFGVGVENDETLPSRVARHAPAYHVYNYGVPGAGVADVLTRVEDTDFVAEIPEREGIGLFIAIADHVRRTAPSLLYAELKGDQPFYREDARDRIVREPTLAAARPWQAAIYRLLSREQILQLFALNVPFHWGAEDVRFTARLLKEVGDRFRAQTHAREFVVVLWPGGDEVLRALATYLDAYGVRYLDYDDVEYLTYLPPGTPGRVSRYDGHPSPQAYALIGAQIARDLRLDEP